MKTIIDEDGFKKAMDSGKPWTTLDCDLTQLKTGNWYWEIQKSVFMDHDASWEALAHGTDGDDLIRVKIVWENFIEKYNPDEYFVDQHPHDTGPKI